MRRPAQNVGDEARCSRKTSFRTQTSGDTSLAVQVFAGVMIEASSRWDRIIQFPSIHQSSFP